VPTEDATPGQEAGLKAQGYNIVPWYVWGWNYWPVDFAQPTTGPLFKQLYVRQALQDLIAQAEWIKQFLHGVGTVESGAVPTNFKTPFAGPAQRHLVYHYSPSAARKLLTSHGWKISSGAADVCVKPGTGANECGAGIKGGATLSFNLLYSSGIPALAQESVAFQTSASSVGIHVSLTSRPYDTVFADYFSCLGKPASSCNWDMINSQVSDFYGWYPDYYPVGAANWVTGALFNGQQYSNPTMNRLLEAAHRGTGLASLYRAEAYVSKELPELWVPNSAYQISAISKKLHVPMPQGSMTNIYPESWTMK